MRPRDPAAERAVNEMLAGVTLKWADARAGLRLFEAAAADSGRDAYWSALATYPALHREELDKVLRELEAADPAVGAAVAEIVLAPWP